VRPFTSIDPAAAWGTTIPQMRFGWRYRFRSFLVAQGGALPPDLWRAGDPAALRRSSVDEAGFSEPVHYLCRTPVAAPRWDLRGASGPAKQVPDGARPLASELPDLPPPIDIIEGSTATFYVSEQDGSGILPFEVGAPLEIRLYGLSLADNGEAVLALRQGRIGVPDEALTIRIRRGVAGSVTEAGGEVLLVLPDDKLDRLDAADPGEWHLRLLVEIKIGTITVEAHLLMEADPAGKVATLEPDLVHTLERLAQRRSRPSLRKAIFTLL